MFFMDHVILMSRFYAFLPFLFFLNVFLHLLFLPRCMVQTRSSDENSVHLSVCPSVTRVDCDKTEERSVHIFIPYER